MGLFDLFSSKKAEDTELRREFEAFKQDFVKMQRKVDSINGDLDILCRNVKVILDNTEHTDSGAGGGKREDIKIKQEIRNLDAKIRDIMAFARLSVQNHDEIMEIKRKISAPMSTTTMPQNTQTIENKAFKGMKDMTSREKEIISVLLNSEIPLSNTEIGSRLGISPITVKGHINVLKKRYSGIILDVTKGKNKKDYVLDQTFRLKVLGGKM